MDILLVGCIKNERREIVGGMQRSCMLLIGSKVFRQDSFVVVDCTPRDYGDSTPTLRLLDSVRKILMFSWHVSTKRLDCVIIMSGATFASTLEKVVMCQIARLGGNGRVYLLPRGSRFIDMGVSGRKRRLLGLLMRGVSVYAQGWKWKEFAMSCGVERGRIRTINNWTATDRMFHEERSREHESVRYVYCGWLNKEKGVEELRIAYTLVSDLLDNVELNIVGDGKMMKEIEKWASGRNDIKMHGRLSNKEAVSIIRQSDVLVLPSHSEGFPNVVIEAMACGVACIVTRVGDITYKLRDGLDCYMVNPRDTESLKDAMLCLYDDDERERIGVNGKKKAVREFETETSLGRLRGMLEEDQLLLGD